MAGQWGDGFRDGLAQKAKVEVASGVAYPHPPTALAPFLFPVGAFLFCIYLSFMPGNMAKVVYLLCHRLNRVLG